MATRLISIACEGAHDVAFVNRLLKAAAFVSAEKIKLGDYPPPMGDMFRTAAQKASVEQLNLSEARQHLWMPTHVLQRESVYVFLHALGGESKRDARIGLLTQLGLFYSRKEGELSVLPEETDIAVVLMLDADEHGVIARLNQVGLEIGEAFPDSVCGNPFGANGDLCSIGGLRIGCYIFSHDGHETGKLEDLLLPLMRVSNEAIFDAAEAFLDSHGDASRHKFLKIRSVNAQLIEVRGTDKAYDRKKSLIGTVAQLQVSGRPNATCINQSDYLTLPKLKTNKTCCDILKFFEKVFSWQ